MNFNVYFGIWFFRKKTINTYLKLGIRAVCRQFLAFKYVFIFFFETNHTANVDLLKMVPVEILLNFGNYSRTLQLGFWKFLSGIVFLYHYVRTMGLFFSQAHSMWPKPIAFNSDRKSMGTPTFYCDQMIILTHLSHPLRVIQYIFSKVKDI